MHANSKLLFARYARPYFKPNLRVLEIGPDGGPSTYQAMVADNSVIWDTIDITNHPSLTYCSHTSEYSFPIPDGSYDIVLSGQVMEHVRKIRGWMQEISRVTKPGGLVITINPLSWPYHEFPVDCWRVYPEGMRALYDDSSLEVLTSVCESLEEPGRGRRIPGRSLEIRPDATGQ